MNESLRRAIALKPRLRQVIFNEWLSWGYFPCYVLIQLYGDVTLHFSDVMCYIKAPINPFIRIATLLCWPFRLTRFVTKRKHDGISLPIPTRGLSTLRFHTFFTDYYFYGTIRRIVNDPSLSQRERQRWGSMLFDIVDVAMISQLELNIKGDSFKVFQFFPKKEVYLDKSSFGAHFLSLTGLEKIDSDADDTFVLLEMFKDFQALLQSDILAFIDCERRQSMLESLDMILQIPYWKLARHYQFNADTMPVPPINYTSVNALGGVSTYFGLKATEGPDLTVNANVLRSLLINRENWKIFDNLDAIKCVREGIDFLYKNVRSGLFRTDRGHSYYIPEFFCSMFARLWQVFYSFAPSEKKLCDPDEKLSEIRKDMIAYLKQDLNPKYRDINPLDAALALDASLKLGEIDLFLISEWVDIICDRFENQHYPYCAYEFFKGKIPTYMVYGSEAITSSFVFDAIDELQTFIQFQDQCH